MMEAKDILDLKMPRNDAKAETVRDYFKSLLLTLWQEEEGFSGKRPFGSSGWQTEVYSALVTHGAVTGNQDADGYLHECDESAADALIRSAIKSL